MNPYVPTEIRHLSGCHDRDCWVYVRRPVDTRTWELWHFPPEVPDDPLPQLDPERCFRYADIDWFRATDGNDPGNRFIDFAQREHTLWDGHLPSLTDFDEEAERARLRPV